MRLPLRALGAALALVVALPAAVAPLAAAGTFTASFSPSAGSEWWVQVKVSASSAPASVHARVDGGPWQALAHRSYGWAASIHAPAGSIVQFRAKASDGSAAYSGCYTWTARTPTSCTGTTSTPTSSSTTTSLLWKDPFTASPWSSTWNVRSSWGLSRTAVTHEAGGDVPTFLRVRYPDGAIGSDSGAEWKAKPFSPQESLHMRYKVRFPVGFDFVRGGKLPGLYGGAGNSGGNIPDGTDGWSTRMMWREGGKGEVYAYLPTSETWGTSLGRGTWNFTADGTWHSVEQEVVLNLVGSANGIVRVWYDGVKVYEKTGLKFRTVSTLKLDGVFFSTFYGGNDASWSPPKDEHADFAEFAVSKGYIGR
ncbi:MAG TPA: hypothetical protein VM370_03320 [Candidatus Thermoplasmatota archaeon]|nr:hypothetical protein [Candidatus Thermoplasmatota archaeon]